LLLVDSREHGDVSAEQARYWEAHEIGNRIKTLIDAKTLIHNKEIGHDEPITYQHIAMLFQSMSHIQLYERVFKALNIPFVTVAGRGYYDSQEVWDLLHLLTVVHNPLDDLSLAGVLRAPLFNLSDDALLALRLPADPETKTIPPLWKALSVPPPLVPVVEQPRVQAAYKILQDLRAMSGRMTIAELLQEALIRTGYRATLTGLPDGARRRGNVEKLLVLATQTNKTTLGAFTEYLRELSQREVREGEALLESEGAITLMTVHASKGLEFPMVIVPDIAWARGNTSTSITLFERELGLALKVYDTAQQKFVDTVLYRRAQQTDNARREAERKRLLYVAMTRAQDRVLLSGDLGGRSRAQSWLAWLLLHLFKIDLNKPDSKDIDVAAIRTVDTELPLQVLPTNPPPHESMIYATPSPTLPLPTVKPQQAFDARLLSAVEYKPEDAPMRSLRATRLRDPILNQDRDKRREARSVVLFDKPPTIPRVVWPTSTQGADETKVSARLLGEIVHEALRWWHFADTDAKALNQLLNSYAWNQGIVDEKARDYAVERAGKWLARFKNTPIYQRIQQAKSSVFRELPFIYQTGTRTIHGIIDVLLYDQEGWAIIDYKSSYVEGAYEQDRTRAKRVGQSSDNRSLLEKHARQYDTQMGVYAAAVYQQQRIYPRVFIHYLRYQETVEIPTTQHQEALSNLEPAIANLWKHQEVEE
jgi:ATP-dependent helicase/nuclease subunit A